MKRQQIKFLSKCLVSVPVSRDLQIYWQIKKDSKYGVFRNLKNLGCFVFKMKPLRSF